MKRLVGVLFCLILVGSVLLPFGTFGADSSKGPSSDDWFVPYQRLPEDIKVILEEKASPEALEFIQKGEQPREDLIQEGWMGREEGDVYPVYHSEGVVYVFRGSGEVRFPDGGTTGVVLSGEDRVTVGEVWSAQALEARFGKEELPSFEAESASSDNRIWAGIGTSDADNKYFGVRANVKFPQFVDPDYNQFNIYTTHVVIWSEEGGKTYQHSFESVVGQYESEPWPECNFAVTWAGQYAIIYTMTPTSGSSYKNAQIKTRYQAPYARMWVNDLDTGDQYYRYEPLPANTRTRRVDLCQEQIAGYDLPTPIATFKPTDIHKGGSDYGSWNRANTPGTWSREDYPLQLSWEGLFGYLTLDFNTWCEEQ
jgi:hypothetical protein